MRLATPAQNNGGLSVNGKATRIWPGTGKPGMMSNSLGFAFFSRMLYTARDYLKVVPPVFNNCTVILDQKDEKEARDLYWDARRFEHEKSDEELEAMYRKSAELNPWVAETHIMLSQLLYKREAWGHNVRVTLVFFAKVARTSFAFKSHVRTSSTMVTSSFILGDDGCFAAGELSRTLTI